MDNLGLEKYKQILKGTPASKGIAEGGVKIVNSYEGGLKIEFNKGDVLVARKTYPDLILHMSKSSAIITDFGGLLSHAAIVSRELKIPCVVGTINATKILKNGMKIKVKCRVILDKKTSYHPYYKYVIGDIRYLPSKIHSPANFWIYGDKILLVLFDTNPLISIRIKSESLANGFKNYFEILWKNSRE